MELSSIAVAATSAVRGRRNRLAVVRRGGGLRRRPGAPVGGIGMSGKPFTSVLLGLWRESRGMSRNGGGWMRARGSRVRTWFAVRLDAVEATGRYGTV
ncbi:hypothetical protein GCM10009779_68900 [Polymorphospora rubra]